MKAKTFTKIMIAFAATALLSVQYSSAQSSRASLGIEYGIPMGDDADVFSGLFGGTGRYEIPVGGTMGVSFTFGFLSYMYKEDVEGFTHGEIPVQAGLRYYFQEQQEGFYGMAEAGVHIGIFSIEAGGVNETETKAHMSYAPALGYIIGEKIDIGMRYQLISVESGTSSYLGFRLAYVFGNR